MNDRAIEHAGLDPWEIRAHLERLGHDPAARLIRQLVAALPMPSRSVGMTAPGRIRHLEEELGLVPETEILGDVAIDARRITGIDRAATRPAFPKPNFGPGVEVIPHKGEIS
jgi:hypothetical protein